MFERLHLRKCILCEEQIPVAATKCHHCEGYQNWRRHLDFGNTLLSLLVAFISVLAIATPVIIKAFTPDNSDISVYYIDRTDVSVPVIVSNDGARPGIMQPGAGMKLEFKDTNGQYHENFLMLQLPLSREDLLIPKESTKQFFFFVRLEQPDKDAFSKLEQDWDAKNGGLLNLKKCTVIGSYIDFKGQDKKYELTIYDATKPKHYEGFDEADDLIMGADGCRIKIPQPVRDSPTTK